MVVVAVAPLANISILAILLKSPIIQARSDIHKCAISWPSVCNRKLPERDLSEGEVVFDAELIKE